MSACHSVAAFPDCLNVKVTVLWPSGYQAVILTLDIYVPGYPSHDLSKQTGRSGRCALNS